MKLYNTLTRRKDEFVTHDKNKVRMYTCGPTVYHFAHIGNMRTYIMEDVLEKYLRYSGYDVTRVMNITDVGHLTSDGDTGEDKMLKGAEREHKTVLEIAKYYTDAFFDDCKDLNIKTPDVVEPATHVIGDIIKIVSALIDKGYAYLSEGNVYFDTSKLDNYYVFNGFEPEDLEEGVREGVEKDTAKRNKSDFVMWFTKSKFENQQLKWDSPWGVGYPGWHIECSTIAMKYLGEYLDLHCGGVDNVFPHHTNEIAQSESYLGHPWCRQWFHVYHLNTKSGKMSKSKGEFLTVKLLKDKKYDPMAYRLFCLQSHYRKVLEFSYEAMDNAQQTYSKLLNKIGTMEDGGDDPEQDAAESVQLKNEYIKALDNDLNTSLALTAVYDVIKSGCMAETKRKLISEFDEVLSLGLLKEKKSESFDEEDDETIMIKELIDERLDARKNKEYSKADEIRNKLSDMGILLKDTPDGTEWHRK